MSDGWNNEVNGVKVDCIDGNFYVRLNDYEALLIELQSLENELEEIRNDEKSNGN